MGIDLVSRNQHRVRGLIVENTFTSIPDMIDVVMPFLSHFKMLCTIGWRSLDTIKDIKVPILFLSGGKDELVPTWMMKKLADAAEKSVGKKLEVFPGGQHMDTFMQPGYYGKLGDWLAKVLSRSEDEDIDIVEEEGEEEEREEEATSSGATSLKDARNKKEE